ncbi:MerR family transcriptional regulator [Streptomyces sp. NPDC093252]|uniref:helix-turn-helix domain-containing protein n=1 Tax=Streptomyces sp. NPDC093252 TaxID=3154980 RepID=UPI00342551D5
MIDTGTGLLTIGSLARATGLSVRTIRYWSNEGVLTPVTRSPGGYRLYDAGSVTRLELIGTLRELGLGLEHVRQVLAGETTVADVAAAHVAALDARIRTLKVTRAVLSTVARDIAPESPEATRLLRDLAPVDKDMDWTAVQERLEAMTDERVARYRELVSRVKGGDPAAARREEFAWVVAAVRHRAAR